MTAHEGWGPGSHCPYDAEPTLRQDHAFRAPVKPGAGFHRLPVVPPGGNGPYEHVVNGVGAPTSGTATVPSTVASYP
ncbi:hypothetical protein [Streptomyces globisporus]|uniref:hypothetical protein n=1 Tax=Streptomyces globisporus TaxID=1908 RepID=UPI0004C7B5B4